MYVFHIPLFLSAYVLAAPKTKGDARYVGSKFSKLLHDAQAAQENATESGSVLPEQYVADRKQIKQQAHQRPDQRELEAQSTTNRQQARWRSPFGATTNTLGLRFTTAYPSSAEPHLLTRMRTKVYMLAHTRKHTGTGRAVSPTTTPS